MQKRAIIVGFSVPRFVPYYYSVNELVLSIEYFSQTARLMKAFMLPPTMSKLKKHIVMYSSSKVFFEIKITEVNS